MSSQVLNLNEAGARHIIAERLKNDINAYAINTYGDGFRWHLGASIIGKSCKRQLWYHYRWVQKSVFDGRMYRLFERGNLEEFRYIEYLKGIGAQIWTHEKPPVYHWDGINPPQIVDKGKQYKVSWVNGHFGGSLDGVIKFPEHYQIAEAVLAEFKTNTTGRVFSELRAEGVAKIKLDHFSQMCVYGTGQKLNYCAYFNTNKNDDDMHVEIIKLDHELGNQLVSKAESIITSQIAPAKISENSSYLDCKMCEYRDVCHSNKPVEKNCRSCIYCVPAENSEFICEKENAVIPRNIVYEGCGNHSSINIAKVIKIAVNSSFEIDNVPLPQ